MMRKIFGRKACFAMALLAGVVLVFILIGCGGGGGGPGPVGGGDDGFTAGWPNATLLAKYDLTGLTAPAGAANIEHVEYTTPGYVGLGIVWKGTPGVATDSSIISKFTSNGWVYMMEDDPGDSSYWEGTSWVDETGCYYLFRKGYDQGSYGRSTYTGDCAISIGKDQYAED
jgi:hypothetical protein